MRTAAIVAFVLVLMLVFGTIYVLMTEGPDVITVLGVIVVAVLAFGVLGALTESPNRRRKG